MTESHRYKIIIVGKQGAGKSALLCRIKDDYFTERYDSNPTADVIRKDSVLDDGTIIPLDLWDLPGNERYEPLNTLHINTSHAAIICVEPSQINDLPHIQHYIKTIRQAHPRHPIIIAITKADLSMIDELDKTVNHFVKTHDVSIMMVSAKTNVNVTTLWQTIASHCLHMPHNTDISGSTPALLALQQRINKLSTNNKEEHAFKVALLRLHAALTKQEKNDAITANAIAKKTSNLLDELNDNTLADIKTLFHTYQQECAKYFKKTPFLARLIGMVIITGLCAVLGIALGAGIGIALGITSATLIYGSIACTAAASTVLATTASSLFFFKPSPVEGNVARLVHCGEKISPLLKQ